MGVQVQGQVPSLALLQLQPPQGELRKLLQQGWKMFPSELQLFSWDLKSPAHGELGDTRGCIQLQLLHRARPALPGAPVCSSVSICDPPGRDTPSHKPGEPGSGASPLRRKGEEEKGDIQLCQASAPTTLSAGQCHAKITGSQQTAWLQSITPAGLIPRALFQKGFQSCLMTSSPFQSCC